MKQVVNAKLTKGYEHWKSEFEKEESRKVRSEAGIKIIGYGWSPQTERLYVVHDIESMEVLQKVMVNPTFTAPKSCEDRPAAASERSAGGAAESRLRQTRSQAAPSGSIGFPVAQVM